MADSNQGPISTFPDPPPFYTHFTPSNQATLRAHRSTLGLSASAPIPASSLPADSPLQYLLPPPPPLPENYWSFAEHWTSPERHPSLEEFGIQRLYSTEDEDEVAGANRVVELRRLSKSLLLSFLELVGVMGVNPEEYHVKTADIQTILFNMHHLINQYRPHQARETLCLMMEDQLQRTRKETEENRAAVRRVEEALLGVEFMARTVKQGEQLDRPFSMESKEEKALEKAKLKDAQGWHLIMDSTQ
ncbi:MED7 protein-domain-containing protein [Sphaerosporella brunnea]|uniref:Mediator of RNA polymerase II transcription subunit 7 n=1 Tax=Sphaerosporella brunnea TaxID=1250544 RepID=A0A5J5F3G7_9PEZI|nr:MED7 protein-domain-containing protein [Sphaerosporella brunnea]